MRLIDRHGQAYHTWGSCREFYLPNVAYVFPTLCIQPI